MSSRFPFHSLSTLPLPAADRERQEALFSGIKTLSLVSEVAGARAAEFLPRFVPQLLRFCRSPTASDSPKMQDDAADSYILPQQGLPTQMDSSTHPFPHFRPLVTHITVIAIMTIQLMFFHSICSPLPHSTVSFAFFFDCAAPVSKRQQELWVHCLQGCAGLMRHNPQESRVYAAELIPIALRLAQFDPNYHYETLRPTQEILEPFFKSLFLCFFFQC